MTLRPTPSVRVCLRVTVVRRGRTCPELRGEWVFGVRGLEISMERPKTRDLEKCIIYLCWRAPPHFVHFRGAPGFRQKRGFQNRQFFAETTENVVRNGRGAKTHFCTVGFEIGHLRIGSNMVPKIFLLELALPVPFTFKKTTR